jgi:hypothetical protein
MDSGLQKTLDNLIILDNLIEVGKNQDVSINNLITAMRNTLKRIEELERRVEAIERKQDAH